ncbi:methionine/alanine import family NSS transporter small subunit [Streptomyces iconiensis]|uniref:Methionine/alanine import family NSS transporter small subunit n=1 Tax=Streptomyces iconiensis TaxID=1384038 RepID=A0ABT7A570_9ACTN|nr:methionine/alanine import family NSS transporter small subunit [Streptomyces iconiensis]MDJ1136469.1 methionine/alanine import family NSS transporter small subunit [Streptomyces iconiensis]
MSTGAIVMMIAAILIVWGGLGLAILRLRKHPDPE